MPCKTHKDICKIDSCEGYYDGDSINFEGRGEKYFFQKAYEISCKYYGVFGTLKNKSYFPIIPVKIFSDKENTFLDKEYPFVLDTSAECSNIPKTIALKLGIDLNNAELIHVIEDSGRIEENFIKNTNIKICNITIPIKITIPNNDNGDRIPSLGLFGIFDHLSFSINNVCTQVFKKSDIKISK